MHCIGHLIVRWQWIILNNAFYVHCIVWSSHDLKGLTMNDSCVFIENDGSRRKFSKTHSNAKYSPIHIGATKFLNTIWIFKKIIEEEWYWASVYFSSHEWFMCLHWKWWVKEKFFKDTFHAKYSPIFNGVKPFWKSHMDAIVSIKMTIFIKMILPESMKKIC